MKNLTISEITTIAFSIQLPPLLAPTSATSDIFSCPICLEFKPGSILSHSICSRLFCALDILALIENNQNCPICREKVLENPWSGNELTTFTRPTPAETLSIENADYYCDSCNLVCKAKQAEIHHLTCPNKPVIHRPPTHIPPKGLSPLLKREAVSNPVTKTTQDPSTYSRSVPLVYYFNGRQVATKMISKNWPAMRVREQLSTLTGVDVDSIKLYKFAHREIADTEKVSQFAKPQGATYLSAFSDLRDLSVTTANLIVHELGPRPIIERPDASWNPPLPPVIDLD